MRLTSGWMLLCLPALLAMVGGASSGSNLTGSGVVFYCDGAGGGGITNWEGGVKQGFKQAGFQGTVTMFPWETQLGVLADQDVPEEYKIKKGHELAKEIAKYMQEYPNAPVDVIGLSAGTDVALHALEALPRGKMVDTVVLLSSSMSYTYDLTNALRHVRGDMYVTTSSRDSILSMGAAMAGTADRKHVDSAGIHGFRMPARASAETRRLYSKVVNLAWRPEYEQYGDFGHHTDTAKASFIEHVIAPLIIREGPRHMEMHEHGSARAYRTPRDQ